MATSSTTVSVPGTHGERHIRVSSPAKVVFPAAGVTKLQLAEYYVAVGAVFIDAVCGRPMTLERFPQGVAGTWFYSKNPPAGAPDWVCTVECTYPSGRSHPQIIVDDIATAVWAVQMNTVVFHPWPSTASDTDSPDELRFDMDPQPGTDFSDAVVVATVLREVLCEVGLDPMVKTSGNRGVHVFAPIEPTHDFVAVRHAVIAAAREVQRRRPELVTIKWWKEERGARVFLDFNQAARDRTIAAAYSTRATPEATVSFPLSWDDLGSVDPRDFTVKSVPGLVADNGGQWARSAHTTGTIDTLLQWWERDVAAGEGELPYPPEYPKMPGEPPRVQPSRRADT